MWCVPVAMEHLVFYAKRICDILGVGRGNLSIRFPFRTSQWLLWSPSTRPPLGSCCWTPSERDWIQFRPRSFAYCSVLCSCLAESIITPPRQLPGRLNQLSTWRCSYLAATFSSSFNCCQRIRHTFALSGSGPYQSTGQWSSGPWVLAKVQCVNGCVNNAICISLFSLFTGLGPLILLFDWVVVPII